MSATAAELAAIDQAYRTAQSKNAAAVAALVLLYFRQVEADNLAKSGAKWVAQALQAITTGHQKAVDLGSKHALEIRALQVPTAAPLALPPAPKLNVEQVRTSLIYTGLTGAANRIQRAPKATPEPTEPGKAADGVQYEIFTRAQERRRLDQAGEKQRVNEAMNKAAAAAAGAAIRHVQNGGRDMSAAIIKRDELALGYVRITRDDCCYFCALLASRGPVYKKDSFKESDARFDGAETTAVKVHDWCGCALRPVYTPGKDEWPDKSREFEDLWRSVKSGSNAQKILAFRQKYEGRYKAA